MTLRLLSTLVWLGLVVVLAATPLEEAHRRFDDKQYDEVDPLLGVYLEAANPPLEVLSLSFDANLALGRWVTASTRMDALLRAGGNSSVDWIWRGAQHAGRMNDLDALRERYRRLVLLAPTRSGRTDKAFASLFDSAVDVKIFERYLALYPADDLAWTYGMKVWDGLRSVRGGEGFLDLAHVMLSVFRHPEHRNPIAARLLDDATHGRLPGGHRRAYGFLLQGPMYDPMIVRNFMEPLKWDYDLLLRGFEKTEVPMAHDALDRLSSLPASEDLDRRLDVGRRILRKETVYKNADAPAAYGAFLDMIIDAPHVFRVEAQELVPMADVQARLISLANRPGRADSLMMVLCLKAHDHYALDAQQRRNLIFALPRHAHVDRLGDYFGEQDEFRDVLLKASGNSLDVRLAHVAHFAKRPEDKGALLALAHEGIARYPGTYNAALLGQAVFQNPHVKVREKLRFLTDALHLGGAEGSFAALLLEARKDEALMAEAGFAALMKDVAANPVARDPLCELHGRIQTANAQDAHELVENAFKSYGKAYPGGINPVRDGMMGDILNRYWEIIWNDAASVARGIRVTAAYLGDDAGWWEKMCRRTREHGQTAALVHAAPDYLKRIAMGWEGVPGVWDSLCFMAPEKDAAESPLAAHYARMSPAACRQHLAYLGSLSRGAWVTEFERMVRAHGVDAYSRTDMKWMLDTLNTEAHRNTLTLPASLMALMWPAFVEGDYAADHEFRYLFMRLHDYGHNNADVLARYVRAGKTPIDQVARFNEAYEWLARSYPARDDRNIEDQSTTHRQGLRSTLLMPALRDVPVENYDQLQFRTVLLGDFLQAAQSGYVDGQSQLDAVLLAISQGARMSGDGYLMWAAVHPKIESAVEAREWALVHQCLREATRHGITINNIAKVREERWAPIARALESAGAWEMLHFMSTQLLAHKTTRWGKPLPENVTAWLLSVRARAARFIPGAYPVSEDDPAFPLYASVDEWTLGNEARAWSLADESIHLLRSEWVSLDRDYLVWALDQLRRRRRLDDVRTLVNEVLLKEDYLTREHLAALRLIKADIYRDEENYEAARIEYESIRQSEALKTTEAARQAKARLLELMIAIGNYDGAEEVLERWRTHSQIFMRSQAYYYTALIGFKRGAYDHARESLQKTFELMPDHAEARLLEGEIKALTGKGVGEPDIPVGQRGEREYIVPGRTLAVTLTDRNLAVVKQGQAVPVVVRTTAGKDRETIDLYPGVANPYEFRASIGTQLGDAEPGSLTLEVMGSDEVLYEVDPAFALANGIEARPAKRLRVLDDARLSASAGRILTEQEELEARLLRGTGVDGSVQAKSDYGRSGKAVRPGNSVYVLVRDLDRDVSNLADTLDVRLETTSGDIVNLLPLRETAPHSGVFRGEAASALPPPRASASDEAEGAPVSTLINSTHVGTWSSRSDGKAGKWVEVDTMSSYVMKRAELTMPRPQQVRSITLLGSLVGELRELACFPDRVQTNGVALPGTITPGPEGFIADLITAPRLRKLRWRFDDYEGQTLSATAMSLTSDEGHTIVPVENDFSTASKNQVVEIAPGDRVDVTYRDEHRTRNAPPVLHAELSSTYYNGSIVIAYETVTAGAQGRVSSRINNAIRYRRGDQVLVIVTEHDLDVSPQADTVPVTIRTSAGETLTVTALEKAAGFDNDNPNAPVHTGIFFAVFKLGDYTRDDMIRVVPGDLVSATYLDRENTVPGVPIERGYSMRDAGHSSPELGIFATQTRRVEDGSADAARVLAQMAQRGEDTTGIRVFREQMVAAALGTNSESARISMGVPFMFEVTQPSMALHAGSKLTAFVFTQREMDAARAEGREPQGVEVEMGLGSMAAVAAQMGYSVNVESESGGDSLEMGLFRGLVRLRVGAGPDVEDANADDATKVPSLAVAGNERLVVRIRDVVSGEWMTKTAELASQGQIALLDDSYTADRETIHMGERFYVRVKDQDRNVSAERDTVEVHVTSVRGGQEVDLTLSETMPYSGVFTASIRTAFPEDASATNAMGRAPDAEDSARETRIAVTFGDTLHFVYHDADSLLGRPTNIAVTGYIRRGADGALTGFSKRFSDPEMAVKVRFLRAEALFEMAKEHDALNNQVRALDLISEGKRILEEALRDYPDTTLVSQGRFLLANLAQELARVHEDPDEQSRLYNEAIARYAHIISSWPDSDFAPQSQFKMAICLEKLEAFDRATEAYVKLTYTWPEHALVPDATVRLANHYYRTDQYPIAAKIFLSFYRNNAEHILGPKSLFLGAQCYIKHAQFLEAEEGAASQVSGKAYGQAISALRDLIDYFPDEKDLRSESMYWLGDTYFKLQNYMQSYIALKKLTWDYPETKWAQYARGYLTDEKFAQIETQN